MTNQSISQDALDTLISLAQLDIDDSHAYRQAIEHVKEEPIRSRLNEFRADHERHIQTLSQMIRKYGGEPPEYSLDFKGYFLTGYTALRGITGTEGALKAMHTNETMTVSRYDAAVHQEMPEDAHALISRNLADERLHLAYITTALDDRLWEK
jgi:uncharacterized protein (TIGR02284 family)